MITKTTTKTTNTVKYNILIIIVIKVKLDSNLVAEKIKTQKYYEKGKFGKTAIYKRIEVFDEIKAKVTKTQNSVYLAQFSHSKDKEKTFNFIGHLDKNKLERCGFGIERNHNKETYAGYHLNDKRDGRGVYQYRDTTDGKYTISSIYMGYWKDNLKEGEGTFVWRKEETKKVKAFESCQLTSFVGFFCDDKYDVGMFCESGDDNTLSMYYGKFSENKKCDDEGIFYYQSPSEFYVVIANVEDDIVREGCKFDFDINDKKFKHFNHFKIVADEEELDEDDDMYETIRQSDNETELGDELLKKYELAKKMFILVQKEKGDIKKIYDAAVDAEKNYKDIKTIEDFYNKYSSSLKSFQAESVIKIDDKLDKAFSKTTHQSNVPKSRRTNSIYNK